MPNLTTTYFRFYNADLFYNSIFSGNNNVYLFIGRPYPWNDENNPPTQNNSVKLTNYDFWSDAMSAKKIAATDISYVIPRYNWSTNFTYDQYSDRDDWANNTFFVLNEDLAVFKCLDNNEDSPSTYQPTTTSNTSFTTSDGYRWKYMYTISATKALNFLSPTWMPVQTLTADDGSLQWDVQTTAANGSLLHVQVANSGSGYLQAFGTVVSANVTHVQMANTASATDNIYNGSAIYISTGLGSGQVRQIVDYVGSTRTMTLAPSLATAPNTSSTYLVSPMVNVVSKTTGSGFIGYCSVNSTAITAVNVLNGGSNYSNTEVVFSSNAGTGAIAYAYLPPHGGHGSDAVRELGGFNVMCAVKLSGNEANTFTTDNEYRTVGLLANPMLANGSIATGDQYDLTTRFTVSSVAGTFNNDEIITGQSSGATGKIVDIVGTQMRVIDVKGTFTTETIQGNDSLATASVDTITQSDLSHYSGELMYQETRTNIPRDPDQLEDYRVVVIF